MTLEIYWIWGLFWCPTSTDLQSHARVLPGPSRVLRLPICTLTRVVGPSLAQTDVYRLPEPHSSLTAKTDVYRGLTNRISRSKRISTSTGALWTVYLDTVSLRSFKYTLHLSDLP